MAFLLQGSKSVGISRIFAQKLLSFFVKLICAWAKKAQTILHFDEIFGQCWDKSRSIFTTAVTWRRPIWLFMFCPNGHETVRQNPVDKATFPGFTLVSLRRIYRCKVEWGFETTICLASVVEAFSKSRDQFYFCLSDLKCFTSVEEVIESLEIVFGFVNSEKHCKFPKWRARLAQYSRRRQSDNSRAGVKTFLKIQHFGVISN